VAVTQTLLSVFGSRMMLPSSGILMNNGIMWFDPEPGKPNSLRPGKRCLTNMSPTVLERSDGARYALGASGGRKIMPATVQIASYLLDYGMDLDSAFHHPRIDTSLAGTAIVDPTLPPEIGAELQEDGLEVHLAPRTMYPYHYACPSAVGSEGGMHVGATEIMSVWGDAVAEPDQ